MSPTSSNDRSNNNDKKDSTACEILIAKIYKKNGIWYDNIRRKWCKYTITDF